MYFSDRLEAGQILSKRLNKYKEGRTTILALSPGGVIVGEYLAKQLSAGLTLLLTKKITIPGEPIALGAINQSGDFSYNTTLEQAQITEYENEFHNHIEAEKLTKLFELNSLTGRHKLIDKHKLKGQTIILVSDGMLFPAILDAAYDYLKPVAVKRLVAATPIASVSAVDRMHILTDEIHCLSVIEDGTFDVNHYYTNNNIPEEETLLNIIDSLAVA